MNEVMNKLDVVVTGSIDNRVRVYSADDFKSLATIERERPSNNHTVMSVYATPRHLLFSDEYVLVKVMDLDGLELVSRTQTGSDANMAAVLGVTENIILNANITAVLGTDKKIFRVLANGHFARGKTLVYDAETFDLEAELCGGYCAAIRNDNLLIGYDDGYCGGIAVYVPDSLQEKHMFPSYCSGKSITATKNHLIFSRDDKEIRAYRLDDLRFVGVLWPEEKRKFNEGGLEHEKPRSTYPNDYWILTSKFHEFAWSVSATDTLLALCPGDNKVRMYDREFGQARVIEEDEERIGSLFMSDSMLITGSFDGSVRVYDVPTMEKIREIKDTHSPVVSVHTNKLR